MICVKLLGGLGNQIFQYAFARRLSLHHNTSLRFDLTSLENDENRDGRTRFELTVFNIAGRVAQPKEFFIFKRRTFMKCALPVTIYKKLFGYTKICGPIFAYDPELLQRTTRNTYISGLYQSEKFFAPVAETIRSDLTFRVGPDRETGMLMDMIESTECPVALHVRRGDYVSDDRYRTSIGTCPVDYYLKALDLVGSRLTRYRLFLFSDEPDWAVQNLPLPADSVVVRHNQGERSCEDLRLMSLCQHQIISNSTFAWWGAWLNDNPDKLVIAPARWFSGLNYDTSDLIPDGWLKL